MRILSVLEQAERPLFTHGDEGQDAEAVCLRWE